MRQVSNNSQNKLNQKITLIVLITSILVSYFGMSIYYFGFKDTGVSYSITQSYKSYFGVEDWNLAKHAIIDIDGDGKQDMITFTNCAFLSSVSEQNIPIDNQCVEPTMSPIGFPNNEITIGQKLNPSKPFRYEWLRKSYLVKTKEGIWKFYDLDGLQIRTYELGKENLFSETKPSVLDLIDTTLYQGEHLGVMLFLIIGSKFFY